MTASQRLRLVIALGAVNLVLAIAAFGLAGSGGLSPQTSDRTAAPSASPGSVAVGSPRPSQPVVRPSTGPGATPRATPVPSAASSVAPASPVPVIARPTAKPRPSTPPIVQPTTAPATNPPATAAPASAPPASAPPPTQAPTGAGRAHPPCPGTTDGAPGLSKTQGGVDRPCRGGETKHSTATSHRRAAPIRTRATIMAIGDQVPVARLEDRGRSRSLRRSRRRMAPGID